MLASKTIRVFLALSAKNTVLVVAVALGFGIPLDALFAFESACFLGIAAKAGADNFIAYRQQQSSSIYTGPAMGPQP